MKISSKSRLRGFTFLEAIVVVAIFSGFLVSTTGVLVTVLRTQVGSHNLEMTEQSSMRGVFEMEHAFMSASGVELVDGGNRLRVWVPEGESNAVWEFFFEPVTTQGGHDQGYRSIGKFGVKVPTGDVYYYSESAFVPVDGVSSSPFYSDDYGRFHYRWGVTGKDGDVPWEGILSIKQ